jgi:nucleoid-associated protein YgaU
MSTTKTVLPPMLALFLTLAPASLLRAEEPAAANAEPSATTTPTPAKSDDDLARKLAATENKLATALRSYSLLQAENQRLESAARDHAQAAQSADNQAVADAQALAAKATAQLAGVRDALRQTQAQAAALAAENAQLRTRLALVGTPPGSMLAAPSRQSPLPPANPPSPDDSASAPAAATAPAATEPPTESAGPATTPHTYVVAAGDNLQKISQRVYGTPDRWQEIFEANRELIKNPNLLFVGLTLRLP